MISISECERLLNKGDRRYSLEEVETISTVLGQLAEIEHQQYKKQLSESSYLHKSIHRGSEREWIQPTGSGSAIA